MRTPGPYGLKLRNRRMRTRMSGGVGGAEPRGSPLSGWCAGHFRQLEGEVIAKRNGVAARRGLKEALSKRLMGVASKRRDS